MGCRVGKQWFNPDLKDVFSAKQRHEAWENNVNRMSDCNQNKLDSF